MPPQKPNPSGPPPIQPQPAAGTRWPKVDSQETTWHPEELAQVLAGLQVDLKAFEDGMQPFLQWEGGSSTASLNAKEWQTVNELQTNLTKAHGQMRTAYEQYVTAYGELVDRFRTTAKIKKEAEAEALAKAKAANPTLANALGSTTPAGKPPSSAPTVKPTGKPGGPLPK